MPAFVSLAFGLDGALENAVPRAQGVLDSLAGPCEPADGAAVVEGVLDLGGTTVPCWLRAYQQDGWTALTLDVREDDFDAAGRLVGRPPVVHALLSLARRLVSELGVPYVHFDEEAEADDDPRTYDGSSPTFGITVLRSDLPGAEAAAARSYVLSVERGPGWITVWRRPDPVPYHVP